MDNGTGYRFEDWSGLFDDSRLPTKIINGLPLLRRKFASCKRRFQEQCTGPLHLFGKESRPFGGNCAGLDHQYPAAKLALNFVQNRLHCRRVSYDDEYHLRPFYRLLNVCVKVGEIFWSPVPASHGMAIGDQIFRPGATYNAQPQE